jgi:hypothetical protein
MTANVESCILYMGILHQDLQAQRFGQRPQPLPAHGKAQKRSAGDQRVLTEED